MWRLGIAVGPFSTTTPPAPGTANMTARVERLATFAVCVALALLAGCGGGNDATLTGKVTRQGQPVRHALMNFHNQGNGPMAYAMTDDSGAFSALTGSQPGLRPGTYKLALDPVPDSGVPEKYFSIEHSGLQFDVKSGSNEIDIKLD